MSPVPNARPATARIELVSVWGSKGEFRCLLCDGAPRSKEAVELAYARRRLCTAAGVLSVDCPYTFADAGGCEADARFARQLGYVAKSAVDVDHAAVVNRIMTPSAAEVREACAIIDAFEAARARGKDRARLGDLLIEVPYYSSARRLVARASALSVIHE